MRQIDRSGSRGSTRLIPLYLFLVGVVGGGIVWTILGNRGEPEQATEPAESVAQGVSIEDTARAAATDSLAVQQVVTPNLTDHRRNAVVVAAETVGPSVVSISVMQTRYVRGRRRADPFGFFDRYLPGPIYRERVPSLGSGFIIDRAGVILTNEHVVQNAEQIKVSLTDGRTLDARLVGADPTYDLAVLRVEGEELPAAPLGDSDDILVGEWAIALGNPFGFLLNDYQPTVTVGVISAKGREIKPSGTGTGIYKDMLQTDAAINPGNSGGPLVNGRGEVIGINTFIFTESGGSLGIGFAIPVNTAKRVVREILQYGSVRQVWTGIAVRPISPYLAAYYSLSDTRGLIVWELEEGSPADRAGVQVGDIIREVNGESVSTTSEATRLIFGAAVGDVISLTVERGGERREIQLTLEEDPRNRRGD